MGAVSIAKVKISYGWRFGVELWAKSENKEALA
jgi:hypothetical protein